MANDSRAKKRLRKEFSQFATQNVLSFAEDTYFLASMTIRDYDDTIELYPGGEATFREGTKIPLQYCDPNNLQKIHPDLVIKVRKKAHRVFHEEILDHHISIWQTILPHPSIDLFTTRGGGAKLIKGQLYPQYKSGVLNGKWSLPLIGENLKYGDLPEHEQPRFNVALYEATGVTVIDPFPKQGETLNAIPFVKAKNATEKVLDRKQVHNYNKNRAQHSQLIYNVNLEKSILTLEERASLTDISGDRLKTKILDFIARKLNSCDREELGKLVANIRFSGEYKLLQTRQNPYFLGRLFKPQTDSIKTLYRLIHNVEELEHLNWST